MSADLCILTEAKTPPDKPEFGSASLTIIHWGSLVLPAVSFVMAILELYYHGIFWGTAYYLLMVFLSYIASFVFFSSLFYKKNCKYINCALLVKYTNKCSMFKWMYYYILRVTFIFLPAWAYYKQNAEWLCFAVYNFYLSLGKEKGVRLFQMKFANNFFAERPPQSTFYRHLKKMTDAGQRYFA